MLEDRASGERHLVDQFLKDIHALPNVNIKRIETELLSSVNGRIDALAELHAGGKSTTLLIEVKKSLFPRDVREALWRVQNLTSSVKEQLNLKRAVTCLVADAISPGAKALLHREQVGYYDGGGSMFIPTSGLYVYVDKPAPKRMKRSIRSVFSGRRVQIVHAVLVLDQDWFSVKEIALMAQVSPATASHVLSSLEKFDWLVSRGRGPNKERRLEKPSELLDAWSNQLAEDRPSYMQRYFVPYSHMEKLVERFSELCGANNAEYAITHEAAAQRYAPYLSSVSQLRCRMLANSAAKGVIDQLGARLVDQGANLEVIEVSSFGELLFREMMNGIWLASPIQVYLDLKRGAGRAEEMAEHLRKERIGF